MSSLTGFSLFKNLPAELRSLVWEIAILDHNQDRIVPVFKKYGHKIVCIRNMVCSPHFSVSRESRQIAKMLYPHRFRVSSPFGPFPHYSILSPEARRRYDLSFRRWAVYISFKHDTFAFLNSQALKRPYMEEIGCPRYPTIDDYSSFGRVAQGTLTPEQCQSVERVVQFGSIDKWPLTDKCRGKLSCAVRRGAMQYDETYDRDLFTGVKRCFHASWTADLSWYTMVRYSEHKLLENLEADNCLIELDEADMNELQGRDEAPKCWCG
ncbi:hypothetical protein F5Y03DRAFT_394873 [Xylaria venustula]|nr:hypothetical protein F5Y03DRAFT_394873 [Xylaria venustula]